MAKVKIQSKPERFRRAGIEFTREGVEIDTAKLTKNQIELINNEPMLTVVDESTELKAGKKKSGE